MILIVSVIIILILLVVFFNPKKESFESKQNKFCVIVTTYNPGPKFIEMCLNSIETQTFKNYDVCVLDDASNKDAAECHKIIDSYCKRNNWKFVKRNVNIGPLGGRIDAINALNPKDDDIIVSIDGDDMLSNKYVFDKLNKIYQDDVLLTFGNYVKRDIKTGKLSRPVLNCNKYKFKKIIKNNSFRDMNWIYTHLKTFKYKLFKQINHADLKRNGKYLKSATDLAIMYPMLEMSGGKFKCVQNVLYKYHKGHPESHNFLNSFKNTTQTNNAKFVKRLRKYQPIF